jgi:hypothetical protein
MLRLAHTQISTGGIIVNDIDDGLPNKTAKRGVGDKDKYIRDGNSLGSNDHSTQSDVNNPKQKCYIPFWKILSVNPLTYSSTVAGYIDVLETDRVLISQDRGVIYGLANKSPNPLITVTSFTAADVVAPAITSANQAAGGAYALTMVTTSALSLAPDVSSVTIGTTVLTRNQILAAGGTFTDTSIIIPEALVPTSMIIGTTLIKVTADNQTTAGHAIAVTNTDPTIATAVLTTVLTLTGTGFRSILPNLTSVTTTGHVGTITAADILAAGGTISDTSIVIPTTTTGYPAGLTAGDTVSVHANGGVTAVPATI